MVRVDLATIDDLAIGHGLKHLPPQSDGNGQQDCQDSCTPCYHELFHQK
jgi:hypothetical protein